MITRLSLVSSLATLIFAALIPVSALAETLIFARGTDNALWVRDRSTWRSLGGRITSAPDACSWGSGRVDVFARGAEDTLVQISRINGTWTRWYDHGGSLGSAPAAVSWGPNRIDVFAVGTDQTLVHKAWNGEVWTEWESLGGTLTSSPDAASWGPNRLDVFARGTDGALWQIAWDGAQWTDWIRLGGTITSDPGAVSWGPDRIDIFARDASGGMAQIAWDGTQWTNWFRHGGSFATTGGADASSLGSNRIEIYGRGAADDVVRRTWNGTRWSEWQSLGGTITSDPGAVVVQGGAPDRENAPQRARFRVSLTGFSVERESWDDILERDGKRDELFLVYQSRLLNREGAVVADSGTVQSSVLGDINRADWQTSRVQAGSASAAGGLKTGDSFPPEFPWKRSGEFTQGRPPLLMWEGELAADGTQLVVVPTIWEWDGDPDFLNRVLGFLAGPIVFAGEPAGLALGALRPPTPDSSTASAGEVLTVLTGRGEIGSMVTANKSIFGDPKDRPIGMRDTGVNYVFEPQALQLTFESARRISRTNFGRGNGIVAIRYRDAEELKGDYTLYVQIESLP